MRSNAKRFRFYAADIHRRVGSTMTPSVRAHYRNLAEHLEVLAIAAESSATNPSRQPIFATPQLSPRG